MKILIAIIVFSVIILFHELGHFLLAKKNGIKVLEFSLGMGPRLLSTERTMMIPAKVLLTMPLSGQGFLW